MVEQLEKDMIEAMKSKDKDRLTVIRMVKAALKQEQIDHKKEINDELLIDVVNRQVKMRKESIVEFEKGNREDLIAQYNDEIIDEVLVTIMKSPKTYTTEDIVEINCHGGIATTNKVMELLLINGCRMAEPGEFTKRAFLNGRIDLVQAESIMDMVSAKNKLAIVCASIP